MTAPTQPGARLGATLWLAILAGCASAPTHLTAPKSVSGLQLSPYSTVEECMALDAGERIDFRFEARLPVVFNVHFRDGNAVIMPISSDRTTSEAGDFIADRSQIYCLYWEAGADGSALDYRVSPWPPHR